MSMGQILENGVLRDPTPEEVAQWEADQEAAANEEPPRRLLPKSVVMARAFALGKGAAIKALFDDHFELESKWFTPDWPNVYFDDDGLLWALGEIGCTSEEVAAITAPA